MNPASQDNKLRVLLITNLFPNPQDYLRGIFVFNMVKELRKKCNVKIISPLPWIPVFLKNTKKYQQIAAVSKEYTIDGIEIYSPKYLAIPKAGAFHTFSLFLSLLGIVNKLKTDIDIINVHWVFPDGVAVSWLAKLFNKSCVLSARGCDINLYTQYLFRKPQIVSSLKKANKITAISTNQKDVIKELGIEDDKVTVIRNGVDSNSFNIKSKSKCRHTLSIDSNDKIIIFVGQIIEVKGFNYLIKAIKMLNEKGLNKYKVKAIGEGHLRPNFEKIIKEFDLQESITFIGEKSREEIPLWFGACDLLCLPSIREGCPNVILEALASGRPVIASKVGGIPELVNDRNGILFEKGNVEQLANALTRALEREWDSQIIQDTIKEYTWESIANQYLNVYKEIFSKVRNL